MKNQAISKEEIKKFLEEKKQALDILKQEMFLANDETIYVIDGGAEILGIQMVGTWATDSFDSKIAEILNRRPDEIGMTFKVVLQLFYQINHKAGVIKGYSNEIRITNSNKTIGFNHDFIRGGPVYFQFEKKVNFFKFKRNLKRIYRKLGLKQKGIFLNVPSYF